MSGPQDIALTCLGVSCAVVFEDSVTTSHPHRMGHPEANKSGQTVNRLQGKIFTVHSGFGEIRATLTHFRVCGHKKAQSTERFRPYSSDSSLEGELFKKIGQLGAKSFRVGGIQCLGECLVHPLDNVVL